ncbi:PDZ domain-containing protein [Actinocorallia sp. API 0066]|uniref:S41 family peptidase n=1 Tax=Actinocorallia sp. API 0066 TaxID=2896846 RepID=UPI001E42349E|nr:S41 family peptidase [Actinocorallia sp. API 0066]MCD0453392.1 PDZ domain-containing protein [Actinocorallia sp. API 0066]
MTSGEYLRYPHLRDGLLTFVAEDDVWLAGLDGGRAWRLSADRAPVSHPRLNADATKVAWTSWRDGDPEVHLAPAEGGVSERITYWGSPTTRVRGWTPGGRVLATSSTGQPFSHYTWAYAVPVDGSTAARLPYGPVEDLALSGEHRSEKAALLTGGAAEPARWKRYRGGGMGRLWTGAAVEPAEYRTEADGALALEERHFTRILPDLGGHVDSVMIVGERVAFLSDHEGVGALYSCSLDGSDLRRHGPLDGFYARHAATDGSRVVYSSAGRLWLVEDLEEAEARPLEVTLGGSGTARRPYLITGEDRLGGFACDATGRASAVEVAGTIHWVTHRDGPARTLSADPGARARLPTVLGGDAGVAWIIDAGTDLPGDALEVAPVSGLEPGTTPRRLAAGRLGWATELVSSPDGKTVAVSTRDGRLILVEIESGEASELAVSAAGQIEDASFSPDSEWLAWSEPTADPLRRIRLARLGDRTIVDVTDGRFEDTSPCFTQDGKFLAFLSWRGFDPVYDQHVFDLSFPFGCRPYLVPLSASTPSPFAPSVDGRPPNGADDKDEEGKEDQHASVDLEGLAARVVPFPVEASRYDAMSPVKGGVVWMKLPLSGSLGESGPQPDAAPLRPTLERFDLSSRKCEEIVDPIDGYAVSGDGERLVIRDRGRLRVVAASGSDDDTVKVDLLKARTIFDPAARWALAYAEAGRLVRHEFWSEAALEAVGWTSVLERYRPLLDRVATPDDFADLLWEVFGELGTSHAYVARARYRREGEWLGMLGADLRRDGDVWRFTRILPGESSDPRARAPLAAPGIVVRPDDILLEIDGRPVDPVTGPGPLLAGMSDVPVELTIGPRDGGAPRRVAVVPLPDDERLRYQDWVTDRRRHVREASEGRLGYLHIPDMVGFGWAQLHRDLRVEMAREGIIVDLRGNRGGHTSQLVVEKLARRIIGWDVPRGKLPSPYPENAPRGPIVAVVDERAGSDGDIISAAIKTLGLGQVIGTRTWGGVIGIDAWHRLADGTSVTIPRYATWFDTYAWSLENHGVTPDTEVVMTPEDWVNTRDPQLDTAITQALTTLADHPPSTPPTPH